jgi:hypothetical protein
MRAGDFSDYRDANGLKVNLSDPPPGKPMPNNNFTGLAAQSPAAAKAGQAMLNFLPLPNICGHRVWIRRTASRMHSMQASNGSAITNWSFNETHPRRNDTLRVDYNITPKLSSWGPLY